MNDYTKEILAKHREKVGASMFMDTRIDEMDKDELLGVIGWAMDEIKARQEAHQGSLNMLTAMARRR